jgi:hypothetical protein
MRWPGNVASRGIIIRGMHVDRILVGVPELIRLIGRNGRL